MIIGHGVDIVAVERVINMVYRHKNRLISRILSDNEIALMAKRCHDDKSVGAFIARRIAAKEAISKAIGCGIGASLAFKDISIEYNEYGAPYVKKNIRIAEAVRKHRATMNFKITISMSDEKQYAIASAILSKQSEQNQNFLANV